MTLISYSQNFEDVLLWRALKHVPQGFYIDVGANDPVLHSVTKTFYDAGWHGINIEPMPSYHAPFLEQRPRDINLGCAAGAAAGEITLFEVPSMNGWASTDADVAAQHRADGYEVTQATVPLRTLAEICASHVAGEIHFLKIDVEGFEGEVLKGMDFARWRPWVLVVEATLPGSTVSNHASWEGLVLPHDYHFAYFDGLNRYYVAGEHRELLAALQVQANVFDAFTPYHLDKALRENHDLAQQVNANWQRVEELAAAVEAVQQDKLKLGQELQAALAARQAAASEAAQAQARLLQADAWGQDVEQRLLAVYASSSWRITAPLRAILRRGPNSLPNLARRKARGALRRSLRWLTSREVLRRSILPLMDRIPVLNTLVGKLLRAAKRATADTVSDAPDVPALLRELPQSARGALADLQRAFDQQAKH